MVTKKIILCIMLLVLKHTVANSHVKSYFEVDTQSFYGYRYNYIDSLFDFLNTQPYEDTIAERKIFMDKDGIVFWQSLLPSADLLLYWNPGLHRLNNDYKNAFPEIKEGFIPYFKVIKNDTGFYYETLTNPTILFQASFKTPFLVPDFIKGSVDLIDSLTIQYNGDTVLSVDSLIIPCYRFSSLHLMVAGSLKKFNIYYIEILFEKKSMLPILVLNRYAARGMGFQPDGNVVHFAYSTKLAKPKGLKSDLLQKDIEEEKNSSKRELPILKFHQLQNY